MNVDRMGQKLEIPKLTLISYIFQDGRVGDGIIARLAERIIGILRRICRAAILPSDIHHILESFASLAVGLDDLGYVVIRR